MNEIRPNDLVVACYSDPALRSASKWWRKNKSLALLMFDSHYFDKSRVVSRTTGFIHDFENWNAFSQDQLFVIISVVESEIWILCYNLDDPEFSFSTTLTSLED